MATIPRTVVVNGPLVLFSRKTSVVAAGAVAEEIEPKIKPKEIEEAKSFVTKYATREITIETVINGTMDSKIKIPTNWVPYFLITFVFNSPPIKNPIRAKAILDNGSKAVIICADKI